MSLVTLLNTSKMGLFANQEALKVVSHNISNVNTPNFSRQAAVLENVPHMTARLSSGRGVRVDYIRQMVDSMVEKRVNVSMQDVGRLETRDRFLPLIEQVFNDLDGDGLASRLDQVYKTAENLSDNPFNPVARSDFLAQTESVSTFLKKMYSDMDRASMPVDQEIDTTLEQINTNLTNLKDINSRIISQEHSDNPALDLKDQRQRLLNELGKMIDIQVMENSDGGVTVLTGGGKMLLERTFKASFARGGGTTDTGFPGIDYLQRNIDITSEIRSGTLKGLLEIRDEVINGSEGMLSRLETLTDEIRWQFNRVHSQSVGQVLDNSRTGVFELGLDLTSKIKDLVMDTSSTSYDQAPPDMQRVASSNQTVVFAYGSDPDQLTKVTVTINKDTDSITDVRDKINAAATAAGVGLTASFSNNYFKLSAAAGFGYGVVEDNSGILAALGVGALFGGEGAGTVAVNGELTADNLKVGAARIREDSAGALHFDDLNNGGAIALSGVRSTEVTLFGKTIPLAAHYGGIVGELGSVVQRNKEDLTARDSTQTFLEDYRESVSGVSLDEELTDLIKFQRSFQASSRMITVADDLLKTIVEMV